MSSSKDSRWRMDSLQSQGGLREAPRQHALSPSGRDLPLPRKVKWMISNSLPAWKKSWTWKSTPFEIWWGSGTSKVSGRDQVHNLQDPVQNENAQPLGICRILDQRTEPRSQAQPPSAVRRARDSGLDAMDTGREGLSTKREWVSGLEGMWKCGWFSFPVPLGSTLPI